MKNDILIKFIKKFDDKTINDYILEKNPVTSSLKELEEIIEDIQKQNVLIENYFDKLLEEKRKILSFNNDIIETLTIYSNFMIQ